MASVKLELESRALDALRHGRQTPASLAQRLGVSVEHARRVLWRLGQQGKAKLVDGGAGRRPSEWALA